MSKGIYEGEKFFRPGSLYEYKGFIYLLGDDGSDVPPITLLRRGDGKHPIGSSSLKILFNSGYFGITDKTALIRYGRYLCNLDNLTLPWEEEDS